MYAYTCTHYSDQSVSMPVDSTSEGTDGVNPTTCIENNSGNRNTLHSTGSSHTSIRQPSHISELLNTNNIYIDPRGSVVASNELENHTNIPTDRRILTMEQTHEMWIYDHPPPSDNDEPSSPYLCITLTHSEQYNETGMESNTSDEVIPIRAHNITTIVSC